MFNKIDEINISLEECKNISEKTYLYIDEETKKEYALKVEQKDAGEDWDTASTEVLEQEFRKLIHLSNEPEIATVNYLVSIDYDRIGYLMELVKGKSLQEYLDENEFIDYETIISFTLEILSGLEKAHHLGIFHNDLHPGNIMINDLGYVKLIDFLDLKTCNIKENSSYDIKSFKQICAQFFYKLEKDDDKRRYLALKMYIDPMTSFRSSVKELNKLIDLVDELMYFKSFNFRIFNILSLVANKKTIDEFLTYKTPPSRCLLTPSDIVNPDALIKTEVVKRLEPILKALFSPLVSLNLIQQPLLRITNIDTKTNTFEFNILFFLTPKYLKFQSLIVKYGTLELYETEKDKNISVNDLLIIDLEAFMKDKNQNIATVVTKKGLIL